MFLEGIICVAARLFVLRINHRVHNSGRAAVLGRLGIGRSEQRTHLRHRATNGTTGLYPCQRILHGDERDQPARLA